jgi:hypothetical protein
LQRPLELAQPRFRWHRGGRMFDDNPTAKRRTMGLAALAAIGLGGATAVDLIVTGGFDFGPGPAPYDRDQPSAYVRIVDAEHYGGARSFGWNDAFLLRPPDTSASEQRLVGADDGSAPADVDEAGGDALYREIASLYSETDALVREPADYEPGYEDAPALDEVDYEEERFYEDEYDEDDEYAEVSEDEAAIVYEGESP